MATELEADQVILLVVGRLSAAVVRLHARDLERVRVIRRRAHGLRPALPADRLVDRILRDVRARDARGDRPAGTLRRERGRVRPAAEPAEETDDERRNPGYDEELCPRAGHPLFTVRRSDAAGLGVRQTGTDLTRSRRNGPRAAVDLGALTLAKKPHFAYDFRMRRAGFGVVAALLALAATGAGGAADANVARTVRSAARAYHVPARLLLRIGYLHTRWT